MLRRGRMLLLLLTGIAVPAAAFGFSIGTSEPSPCLLIGNTSYRLVTSGTRADYTVRIDPAAVSPDIRMHLADTPDEADFVLVDDGEASRGCGSSASPVRTVRIDAAAAAPDVVVSLTDAAAANYRIYVRAQDVPAVAAAALAAVGHMARRHASRTDHSN